MPGGLMSIVAYGNQNVFLNGNPSKTLFRCTYAKYTNFGLQKFRLDFDGQRTLRMNEDSTFQFKVKRYAELLLDTYLVVQMPTIWSPIVPPVDCSGNWRPYEFKWIDNLGTQMIREVRFLVGSQIVQRFSGQYLYNLVERDFQNTRKQLYNQMTGNVPAMNDPANAFGRSNVYPSAYYTPNPLGPEPSIRSRLLYIPLNIWFTLAAKMPFPLVSLQYNELMIEVTLRPINELFVVRDVTSLEMNYIQSNQNDTLFQFYRFLQPPPNVELDYTNAETRTDWAADVHLVSTYAFLSEDETKVFAANEQRYLIKEVYEYQYDNVTGTKRVNLDSLSMVANYTWYYQRDDAYQRNEWSNYTNWPYRNVLPQNTEIPLLSPNVPPVVLPCGNYGPAVDPYNPYTGESNTPSLIQISGVYNAANQREILQYWALILDGKYRENEFDFGVWDYVEKYAKCTGDSGNSGQYVYSFGLHTNPFDFQPSGAMNMSKFKTIEFEFSTYQPPLDPQAAVYNICNPLNPGQIIGVNKPFWQIFSYNYNLHVMEERYNILTFVSGNAALMYAR